MTSTTTKKKRKYTPDDSDAKVLAKRPRDDLRFNPSMCTFMDVRVFYDATVPKKALICTKDWLLQFFDKKSNVVTRTMQNLGVPAKYSLMNKQPGQRTGQALGVLTIDGVFVVLDAIRQLPDVRRTQTYPSYDWANKVNRETFLPQLERLANGYVPSVVAPNNDDDQGDKKQQTNTTCVEPMSDAEEEEEEEEEVAAQQESASVVSADSTTFSTALHVVNVPLDVC
jgi:hypothetical protein